MGSLCDGRRLHRLDVDGALPVRSDIVGARAIGPVAKIARFARIDTSSSVVSARDLFRECGVDSSITTANATTASLIAFTAARCSSVGGWAVEAMKNRSRERSSAVGSGRSVLVMVFSDGR